MTKHSSDIVLRVGLDENHVPESIEWHATDNQEAGVCDAAFVTLWDKEHKNTLRMDLWTKGMMVDDMRIFFHQALLGMSDTYLRATGEEAVSRELRDFALQLGEKMGILRKKENE